MSIQLPYTSIVREAFSLYLDQQIDLDTLIERLREIELQVMSEDPDEEETGKRLWFRFFEGDPLQTTIEDIETDLSQPSHPNSMILQRGIALGLESNELEVHYS
ncbi:hypothetical protein CLV24_108156 [Pontibacter ummariensis]|uniref:Uncharacterized protein n=1 Tax=Pontibacter ummariensis TaxID=1610492 RepID=A0A239F719_9BACT|nr:hypothetical protein [Pontibacter ummariensis]PRY12412.1 hypothetical protein CLV24_108156 [Pontibacter ummariensis]SNS52268.1 hypothetical protein SAMN06296052_10829 [Pontibacter ummariensis]